jgi:hypothetical protein
MNKDTASELSETQKAYLDTHWSNDLRELVRTLFANPNLTLRSAEAKAVRQYLASIGKQPVGEAPSTELQLTEEQKLHIENNIESASGPVEMAIAIFNNARLGVNSRETRAVAEFCRTLDPNYRKNDELVEDLEYIPPKSINVLIGLVNKYAINPRQDGKAMLDPGKIGSKEQRSLLSLQAHMQTPLFRVEASKFIKKIDREVFESQFIANCWGKTDLSSEHVLQYIQLCSLTVKNNQLDRIAQKLDDRMEPALDDSTVPLKMPEVETLNAMREKIVATMKQITALIKTLTGERAKIAGEKMAGSASMHNLVETWKNEEDRKRIIMMNERRQKKDLKKEVERFSDMDSLKIEIFGLDKNDILK